MNTHLTFPKLMPKLLLTAFIIFANSSCTQPTQTEAPDPIVNIYIVGPNGSQSIGDFNVSAEEPISHGCTCEGTPVDVTIKIHASGGKPPYTLAEYPDMSGDSFTIPVDKDTGSLTLTVQSSDGLSDSITINIPSCNPPPTCNTEEICKNNKDDDGDGKIDEDCGKPSKTEVCNNEDDDGDGQVDEGCSQPPKNEICTNGIDDDGDGKIDNADPDCYVPEICTNGIDDDGDGKIDSADPDCPPPPKVEICGNGIDDDSDGKIDSADPDCPPDPPAKWQCDDGKDNDADGLIDLADPQCKNRVDDSEVNN